jgi:hypothetical protein
MLPDEQQGSTILPARFQPGPHPLNALLQGHMWRPSSCRAQPVRIQHHTPYIHRPRRLPANAQFTSRHPLHHRALRYSRISLADPDVVNPHWRLRGQQPPTGLDPILDKQIIAYGFAITPKFWWINRWGSSRLAPRDAFFLATSDLVVGNGPVWPALSHCSQIRTW